MGERKVSIFDFGVRWLCAIGFLWLWAPGPAQAAGDIDSASSCEVIAGQVLINEVLPAPSNNGIEWAELYNTTSGPIDIGNCYIDDIPGASPAYHIPSATLIPAHGFWTVDQVSYFNNTGDSVRFLKEDVTTLLDSYSFGSTAYNQSWYRLPDGGSWAASPTAFVTKGQANKIPFFSISGNVGVAGATLSYVDGTPRTVISRIDGSYTLTVPGGWSGTVTPSHPCFSFDPVGWDYNNVAGNLISQDYIPSLDLASGCADVDVSVRRLIQGRFGLPPHASLRANLTGLNDGPIIFNSSNGSPLIAAERVIYKVSGVNTSFSEMMALPDHQLDATYWLPWYNNKDLDTQLRFANVSETQATVHLYIGGQEIKSGCLPSNVPYPYVLESLQSLRVSCPGLNNGPVEIQSNVNIVAAERVIYKVNNVNTSFSEMMALPNSQLSSTYWLPWYNDKDLDTQLRFGNVDPNATATVTVKIGGVEVTGCLPHDSPFTLGPGESVRVSCAGLNNGPVEIESNVNIVAAERVIYKAAGGINTSFSEMMALPSSQLDATYSLPWYNNADLDTQLRFGNVTDQTATVHLYIHGQEMISGCNRNSPYNLAPGQSLRVSCTGLNNGSVQIVSDHGVPIVAAERVIFKANGLNTSFSEMMALPNSQIDTIYWLPWYNNVDLDTQLRFGVP